MGVPTMNYLFLDRDGKFFLKDFPTSYETGAVSLPRTPPPPTFYAEDRIERCPNNRYYPHRWFNPATHETQTIFLEDGYWDKDKTQVYNEILEFFKSTPIDSRFAISDNLYHHIKSRKDHYALSDYIRELGEDVQHYKRSFFGLQWKEVNYRRIIKALCKRLRTLRRLVSAVERSWRASL